MAHDEVFEAVAAERLALADMLEGLTPEQLATPSLCAGWSVQNIGAHLTFLWTVPFPSMMWRVIAARGSFPKAVDGLTKEWGRTSIAEIVAGLRAHAHHRKHPPGLPPAPLTDVIVHGEDARIPLGIVRGVNRCRPCASRSTSSRRVAITARSYPAAACRACAWRPRIRTGRGATARRSAARRRLC